MLYNGFNMKENDREQGTFYITHAGELLIWLLVVLFFVSVTSTSFIIKEKQDKNDYQIFLQDVDGLIVGSPVRMMGIEVGYITKIKPTKDEVYVKFVLTNPDVYIPQGTAATVEFTGMAGSKSLELYLPENKIDENAQLITVNPPKRLHDALGLLHNMFKKLDSIIFTASSFGRKLDVEEMKSTLHPNSATNMLDFLKYSDDFLDNSNQKATDIRKSLEGFKKDVK